MRLDVSRLKRSPGATARYEPAVDLPPHEFAGEEIIFAGPVKADLVVTNTGKALEVEGLAGGKLELSCGRCLQHFIYDYQVPIVEKYALPSQEREDIEESQTFTGDYIDLTPSVVNSIFIALPMKIVCAEGCLGLCPVCGANLNEKSCRCAIEDFDPRLGALKELLKKD